MRVCLFIASLLHCYSSCHALYCSNTHAYAEGLAEGHREEVRQTASETQTGEGGEEAVLGFVAHSPSIDPFEISQL